jgi:hypothetical protein
MDALRQIIVVETTRIQTTDDYHNAYAVWKLCMTCRAFKDDWAAMHGQLPDDKKAAVLLEMKRDRVIATDMAVPGSRPCTQLARRGLLTPMPTKEWLARRFSGMREMYAALDTCRHVYSLTDRDWIIRHVHPADLATVFNRCRTSWHDDAPKEWYATNVPKRHLYAAMKNSRAINACDAEWLKDHMPAEDLLAALKVNRRVYTVDDHHWLAEHLPKDDMYGALCMFDLFHAEFGRDWYAEHVSKGSLLDALRKADLLTADPGPDWYRVNLTKSDLRTALEETGLLTAALGLPWLMKALTCTDMYKVCKSLGIETPQTREFVVNNAPKGTVFDELYRLGLVSKEGFADDAEARSWVVKTFPAQDRLDALLVAGLVTAEPGADWYRRALNAKDVRTALRVAGLY